MVGWLAIIGVGLAVVFRRRADEDPVVVGPAKANPWGVSNPWDLHHAEKATLESRLSSAEAEAFRGFYDRMWLALNEIEDRVTHETRIEVNNLAHILTFALSAHNRPQAPPFEDTPVAVAREFYAAVQTVTTPFPANIKSRCLFNAKGLRDILVKSATRGLEKAVR